VEPVNEQVLERQVLRAGFEVKVGKDGLLLLREQEQMCRQLEARVVVPSTESGKSPEIGLLEDREYNHQPIPPQFE
jgi:hypothetical protein